MGLSPVVTTSTGRLCGTAEPGLFCFRGVPYAADTSGANRFRPPQPTGWTGVREALAFGPRAPQNEPPTDLPFFTWIRDPGPMSEDCLALNVFTPALDEGARLPVLVYLHGGGFMIGSAGAPGSDGSNLARRGAVVVTANHRLNLFGFLHLGELDGGRFAEATNAGMLDLVATLEWVRDNIGRFGGDPGNVTLFGQSGGSSKVAMLRAMPRARGLFHKSILQSASSMLRTATLEEAQRNTHHYLRTLGVAPDDLRPLQELPMERLLQAHPLAIEAAGRIDNYRPVVDGHVLPTQAFDPSAVQLSSHVPLLVGWCENEQRLNFAATPEVFALGAGEALAATARALDVPETKAAALLEVYRRTRPQDAPGDLFAQVKGDFRYRRSVTQAAELQLAHAQAPAWLYLLAWKTPVQNGLLRSPHTLCIPFVFANVDRATGITGTGPDRYQLQDEMASAWLAFARSGDPNHPGLPNWPRYDVQRRPTLVFDRPTRLVDDPLRDERIAWERVPVPPYVAAIGEARPGW